MQEYRAYLIGQDGHFIRRIDLLCADDGAAKEQAKALMGGDAIELWQKGRMIATFEPPK
jgi:hypothetical protein